MSTPCTFHTFFRFLGVENPTDSLIKTQETVAFSCALSSWPNVTKVTKREGCILMEKRGLGCCNFSKFSVLRSIKDGMPHLLLHRTTADARCHLRHHSCQPYSTLNACCQWFQWLLLKRLAHSRPQLFDVIRIAWSLTQRSTVPYSLTPPLPIQTTPLSNVTVELLSFFT